MTESGPAETEPSAQPVRLSAQPAGTGRSRTGRRRRRKGLTRPTVPGSGRLIGVDLGTRRIGVATCDDSQRVATGVTKVQRSSDEMCDHRVLADLVDEYGAAGVVVGLPLSLSGDLGPAARAALGEADRLAARVPVPVALCDERFTTVTASQAMTATARSTKHQRGVIDQEAAAVMLQSWLDRHPAETRSNGGNEGVAPPGASGV